MGLLGSSRVEVRDTSWHYGDINMANRFGGALAARPLQFIWIADCSGSMAGKKIEALNFGIREAIQPMRDVADENPNAQVMVRAIKFSDGAQWHFSQPTDIHDFKWTDLTADATTDMGKALQLVAEALKTENMPERGLPPVLVLLSDGQPTDDFNAGLKALMDQPWGGKAVRIAIAIGDDADVACLQKFIGHPERKPIQVTHANDLAKMIKWASTVPLKAASNPNSQAREDVAVVGNVPVPAPPASSTPVDPGDVF
jgi:uncharacterized protein YegL